MNHSKKDHVQEVFEKVIHRDQEKKLALVKRKGHPSTFNTWIPIKDIKNI